MDKEIIKAYLWYFVIKKGFCPSNFETKGRWLRAYCGSLSGFWQADGPFTPTVHGNIFQGEIRIPYADFCLEYSLRADNYLDVRYLHHNNIVWSHHSHPDHIAFPIEKVLHKINSGEQVSRDFSVEDLEKVIDSLIIHPREHQHLDIIGVHTIRIGGGLVYPFLYLYHLRYQFCRDECLRNAERRRLISLFENAIRNYTEISIVDLMTVP